MADGIIYDTNFDAALEAEVNTFREALTKRWREEVAIACWQNSSFRTAFHRYQAPYGEDLWDYWDPINRLHLISGPCEVVEWAKGDQRSGAPSCPGRINVMDNVSVNAQFDYITTDVNGDKKPQYRAQAVEAFKASMKVIIAGLTWWSPGFRLESPQRFDAVDGC